MFLFERIMWSARIENSEQRKLWEDLAPKDERVASAQSLTQHTKSNDKVWEPYESVSEKPTDAESLYFFSDDYIDVRAAFQEEKRGLITFGFLVVAVALNLYAFYASFWVSAERLFLSSSFHNAWSMEAVIGAVFKVTIWGGMNYYLWKYIWRWVRVELFTQRYLVARFHRKTRQVYLNRPKYAGGMIVLPWEAVVPGVSPEDPEYMGIGGFLLLAFMSEHTGAGYDETLMLGRPMHGNEELVGFWEFIRRYMEEGPQSVPKPKRLLTLRPTPIEPIRATLRFMSGFWRNGGKVAMLITGTLLSPLIMLHALCHWISLLLCWAPRWPKEIQEAGQPGKPIPKLTTAEDFGPIIGANLRANTLKERLETPMPERKGWRPATRSQ